MSKFQILLILVLVFVASFYACKNSSKPAGDTVKNPEEKLFTLLQPGQTGIDFINQLKEDDKRNIFTYEYLYNGSGVAVGDLNGDGLPELFFASNFSSCKLYRNDGNMHFTDITEAAGISTKGWCSGVTMADVNEDGLLDIYVCRSAKYRPKGRANLLFINDGNLVFHEAAADYGINEMGHSTIASFFDYNHDGHLDLFVGNHQIKFAQEMDYWANKLKNPDRWGMNRLYKNEGNGHFKDVTDDFDLKDVGFALSVTTADIDMDGWDDIYVTNDYIDRDYMYINQQGHGFKDELTQRLKHISNFGMGADIADYNNDSRPDIFVLDMLAEGNHRRKMLRTGANIERKKLEEKYGYFKQYMRNTLQLNNGNGTFSEISQLAGISATDWSWVALLADFDGDAWKDLLITNGYRRDFTDMDFLRHTLDEETNKAEKEHRDKDLGWLLKQIPVNRIKNYLYQNNHDLSFSNQTDAWGLSQKAFSMGGVYADLDNDGDLDIVMNNLDDTAFVYRNNSHQLNWFKLSFKGNPSNAFGIGCKAWIKAGNNTQYQELVPVRGYQSSLEPLLYFAIANQNTADTITVEWPGGMQQSLSNVAARQSLTFYEDSARTKTPDKKVINTMFRNITASSGIRFQHHENEYMDYKRQPLLPHKMSNEGPALAVADVNGDGLDDFFVGGAYKQSGVLYIQKTNGSFRQAYTPDFDKDAGSEDVAALFFDADNDHDPDLYVVSGGGEFVENANEFPDRLYLNDGKGHFSKSVNMLPDLHDCGSCVSAADFDRDGDLDLFVGTLFLPGKYPYPVSSRILVNEGAKFVDKTASICPQLINIGMVRSATWADINSDDIPELIIGGEWMPIKIFEYQSGKFIDITQTAGLGETSGWWFSLATADLDGDGDLDLIAGNRGLNDQLQASASKPVMLYADDFDRDGQVDPFICEWFGNNMYPVASYDEFNLQVRKMRGRYKYFKDYADLKISDIFSPEQLNTALILQVQTFASAWFENTGHGHFIRHDFPNEAQFSPLQSILIKDLNHDTYPDLLLSGNYYPARAESGPFDASIGTVLLNNGDKTFRVASALNTGLILDKDIRKTAFLQMANNKYGVLAARNNDRMILYQWQTQH